MHVSFPLSVSPLSSLENMRAQQRYSFPSAKKSSFEMVDVLDPRKFPSFFLFVLTQLEACSLHLHNVLTFCIFFYLSLFTQLLRKLENHSESGPIIVLTYIDIYERIICHHDEMCVIYIYFNLDSP